MSTIHNARYAIAGHQTWPPVLAPNNGEAWHKTFIETAWKAALVTDSINGLSTRSLYELTGDIWANLPKETAASRLVTQSQFSDLGKSPAVSNLAQSIDDAICSAIECLRAAQSQLKPAGAHHSISNLEIELISDWRAVCSQFLHVMELLTSVPLESDAEGQAALIKCLQAAVAGEKSLGRCHSIGGNQGSNFQSRCEWTRRDVNIECSVSVGGRNFAAVVRNISQTGALIDGIHGLRSGCRIRVTTMTMQELDGTIAWAARGAAGLKFDRQIPVDSPLLSSDSPAAAILQQQHCASAFV
jgi:hypothetical protein